jgi:hypothetical protein
MVIVKASKESEGGRSPKRGNPSAKWANSMKNWQKPHSAPGHPQGLGSLSQFLTRKILEHVIEFDFPPNDYST